MSGQVMSGENPMCETCPPGEVYGLINKLEEALEGFRDIQKRMADPPRTESNARSARELELSITHLEDALHRAGTFADSFGIAWPSDLERLVERAKPLAARYLAEAAAASGATFDGLTENDIEVLRDNIEERASEGGYTELTFDDMFDVFCE